MFLRDACLSALRHLATFSFAVIYTLGAGRAQPVEPMTNAAADSHRFRLASQVHPLATAANDRGRVDAATTLSSITLNFAPKADQQAALEALLVR